MRGETKVNSANLSAAPRGLGLPSQLPQLLQVATSGSLCVDSVGQRQPHASPPCAQASDARLMFPHTMVSHAPLTTSNHGCSSRKEAAANGRPVFRR